MIGLKSKYLGPTYRRGSRIRVTDGTKSLIVNYSDEFSPEVNHSNAMKTFLLTHLGGKSFGDWHIYFGWVGPEGVGIARKQKLENTSQFSRANLFLVNLKNNGQEIDTDEVNDLLKENYGLSNDEIQALYEEIQ